MTHLNRRSLITGLISFVAAPAIVRAGSLMPVKAFEPKLTIEDLLRLRIADVERVMQENIKTILFGDRYYGISGSSASVYASELLPLKLHGVDIRFDPACQKDTVYLLPGYPDDA